MRLGCGMRSVLLIFVGGVMACAGKQEEPESTVEREAMVAAIRKLADQGYGLVLLGTPGPMRTEVVNTILSYGNAAVPDLVISLEGRNLVQVGYAAFCLELLRSEEGLGAARQRLAEFSTGDLSLMEARFARAALDSYVKSPTSKK